MESLTVIGRSPFARLLADILECPMNVDADVAIRYGNHRKIVRCEWEINNLKAVQNARNKDKSLRLFREWDLPVPKFSHDCYRLNLPILGRDRYHYGGTDIAYYDNYVDAEEGGHDYYIEYLPIDNEFRYHIAFGGVINSVIKTGGDITSVNRNHTAGWVFKDVKKDEFLFKLSNAAIECLGLDFGAVDIIISKGKPYLLEINTAPAMVERRMKKLAKEINRETGRGYLDEYNIRGHPITVSIDGYTADTHNDSD